MQWPDNASRASLVLPVGEESVIDARTVVFAHQGQATSGGQFRAYSPGGAGQAVVIPNLRSSIVIVGSLAEDVHGGAPQTGPKLLAWAVNDVRSGYRSAREPLNQLSTVLIESTIGENSSR